MPAKTGIQNVTTNEDSLDSRLRGNDVAKSRLSCPPRIECGINFSGHPEDLQPRVLPHV